MTSYTDHRSIVITVDQLYVAPTTGFYKFTFNGQSLALPTRRWSAAECQIAFASMANLQAVQCGVNRNGRFNGYTLLVYFLSFPVIPYENNLYTNDGNPPLSTFSCDTYGVTTTGQVACTITEVAGLNFPGTVMHPPALFC
jgi:hypothetical protein